jgi:hypothetical protein
MCHGPEEANSKTNDKRTLISLGEFRKTIRMMPVLRGHASYTVNSQKIKLRSACTEDGVTRNHYTSVGKQETEPDKNSEKLPSRVIPTAGGIVSLSESEGAPMTE